jgi:hypothetical protein
MPYQTADLQNALDRQEIAQILSRFFATIDDQKLNAESVERTYTPQATFSGPAGSHSGHADILKAEQFIYSKFQTTHHSITDYIIDVDGDSARLRANMTAMHVWAKEVRDELSLDAHFIAGAVWTGATTRTPAGWRFNELTLSIVWRQGWMPLNLLTQH